VLGVNLAAGARTPIFGRRSASGIGSPIAAVPRVAAIVEEPARVERARMPPVVAGAPATGGRYADSNNPDWTDAAGSRDNPVPAQSSSCVPVTITWACTPAAACSSRDR
jgi:hypothetical protein